MYATLSSSPRPLCDQYIVVVVKVMARRITFANILVSIVLLNFSLLVNTTDPLSQSLVNYSENDLHEWEAKVVNSSNPPEWPGEYGRGYQTTADESTYKKFFKINEFNILSSDRIALNRTLKDNRIVSCQSKPYRPRLPTTSVIIVFHNEAFSTLVRTVHSVIKTSSNLLLEIILVDDSSTKVYLKWQLEDYVKQLSVPVRIIRLSKRSGLIWARLLASAHARGQVLTFLDSHCECNEGWLEPLLDRIAADRTRVVCPIIDVIDEHSFEYIAVGDALFGGFDWKIGFRWYNAPQRELKRRGNDRSLPLRTPTLAGGLFAIDRDHFDYIGQYDPGMIIWGAENLEISFRIWTCGGSIEIVPCSRVGHVFRSKTPYTLPGGSDYVVWHNTGRLVDVWLDEWKDFYYALHPGARLIDRGPVQSRKLLRRERKCQSFQWYLDNVYPESHIPRDYHFLGDIRNVGHHKQCLFVSGNQLVLSKCSLNEDNRIPINQLFMYSMRDQIVNDENCLDGRADNGLIAMAFCRYDSPTQKWVYNTTSKALINEPNKLCLDVSGGHLTLGQCDDRRPTQKWLLEDNFEWQSPQHLHHL